MRRMLATRKSKVFLLVLVFLLVVLAGGGTAAWVATGEKRRTVQSTVADFFAAQRAGDCVRLTELVTTDSWSANGKLSTAEFVRQCRPATKDAKATYSDLRVVSQTRDRATVTMRVRFPRSDGNGAASFDDSSTLRREDGVWRLTTDGLLRIGRTFQEVVYDYVDAARAGDCHRMAGLLDTSSAPANFLARCEAERNHAHAVGLTIAKFAPAGKDKIDVTVFTTADRSEEGVTGAFTEQITLVYRDFQWKLALPSFSEGRLAMIAALELGDRVIEPASLPTLLAANDPADGPKQTLSSSSQIVPALPATDPESHSPLYGFQKTYAVQGGGRIQVDLFAFGDEKAAVSFSHWMVDYYLDEYGDRASGEAHDIGVPNATGLIGYVNAEHVDVFDSILVSTRGNLMARVWAYDFGGSSGQIPYDYARDVLKAQLDRL